MGEQLCDGDGSGVRLASRITLSGESGGHAGGYPRVILVMAKTR